MKRFLNVILKGVFLILVFLAGGQYYLLMKNDISTTTVLLPEEGNPPVYLVSYADGPSVFLQNQNTLAFSALNKGVDFILNYRRSHIDPHFIQEHSQIFSQKKGAGYWLWKPWIILHTLESLPEQAIVFYADSGIILRNSIRPLIHLVQDYDMLLVEGDPTQPMLGARTKREVFIRLHCDTAACRNARSVHAYFLVLRNTPATRQFIKKWLDVCLDADLLMDSPSSQPEYPEFRQHFHDQSLLATLCYLEPKGKHFLSLQEFAHYASWPHRHPGPYRKIHTTADDIDAQEADSLLPYCQNNLSVFALQHLLLNNWVVVRFRSWLIKHGYIA